MILPVMVALWLAGVALASAVAAGLAASRQGRMHAWTQLAAAAADAALADAETGGWLGAAGSVPVGGRLALPGLGSGRVATVREARRVDHALWVILARTEVHGAGGVMLAGSERGLLVRVVQDSAVPGGRIEAAARPLFRRPE